MSVKNREFTASVMFNTITLAALSACATTPLVLAETAGQTQPTQSLEVVDRLISEQRLIAARATLLSALKPGAAPAGEAQRANLIARLDDLDARIAKLGECEVTLQKSDLLRDEGDLRMAQRYAEGVQARTDSSATEKARATQLLESIAAQRAELSPKVSPTIALANEQYAAGEVSTARTTLAQVRRWGVELSGADRRTADELQVKLLDRDLAMIQPGTVKRDQPSKPSDPAGQSPASEPLPQMNPITEPAPRQAPAPAVPPEPVRAAEPATAPIATPAAGEPVAQPMNPASGVAVPDPSDPATDMMQIALKADAQRTLAEADSAFDAGRYAESLRKYQLASTTHRQYLSVEEVARVDRRLAEARVRLRDNSGGTLVDDQLDRMRLVRERATAEFASQSDEASRALASGDTKRARDLNAGADVTVKNARSFFSQAELDAFEKKVNDLNAEIARREDLARANSAREREGKLRTDAESAQTRLRDDREQKVFESLKRARELQIERRYAEASQIVDQVLYLDPNNPGAQMMRDVLTDLRTYDIYQNYKRRQGYGVQKAELDTHESLIAPPNIMQFPENWPTKTYTRTEQLGASESPENRRAMASLEGRKVPVAFKGATLDKVLANLSATSQTDITANWESLKSIGVEPGARVNLSLSQEIPAKVALEKVLEFVRSDPGTKLDYSIEAGVITIASADTIKRKTTSLPYNITDLLLETPDYKDVPELDLARVLASKADLDTRSGPFAKSSARDERNERTARIRQIVDMVQRTIDPESWREAGGETGAITEINGTLVITQTPRNHAAIAGLLSKLREIRSIQINIESRFLLVSQDYFEQIGFDVDVYFNAQSNVVTAAQGLDPAIRPSDFFDFTQGSPLRRTLSSTTYAPNGSVIPVIIPPGTSAQALQNSASPTSWSPIGATSNSLNLTQGLLPAAGFARDIVSSAPALGIAGQFLDDIQVDFLIKATQADRRTVTLTAPRLTLTNGQTSNVYVVTQRAIITDLEPVVGESAVGFDPTTGTVAEGVVMLVEAVVSSDRRFVTLNIDSSVNVIREIANQRISAVVGGALVNSAETGSFIQLPVITTTRVQTTATVPDEGTLLLGGQRLVTEVDVETGVPVLSKIPIINRFFTNRIQSKEESTLMILVKPTILIQTEEEERSFPGLMDTARTGLGN